MVSKPRRSLLLLAAVVALSACRSRNQTGELTPPKGAAQFSAEFARDFDDDFTATSIKLQGRAPNDVLDQRLFSRRLGLADVVAVVEVRQVWGKGRYEGRKEQLVDVLFQEVVLGSLSKGTYDEQLLRIDGEDSLGGELQGHKMVLFIKWAPGEQPPFHHHLMPVDPESMAYITAMIKHAQAEGVLNANGEVTTSKRKQKRSRKRREKEGNEKGAGKGEAKGKKAAEPEAGAGPKGEGKPKADAKKDG